MTVRAGWPGLNRHHKIEQIDLRKNIQHIGQFSARDQNRSPSRSFQGRKGFEGFFRNDAMYRDRIVIVGRERHKKHAFRLRSFYLR